MSTNFDEKIAILVQNLKDLSENNAEYFANDFSENGRRLCKSSLEIGRNLDGIAEKMARIGDEAYRFDFDESTPANGYRTYVNVGKSALDYGINLNEEIVSKRNSFWFPKNELSKHLDSYSQLLYSLDVCLRMVDQLLSWSTSTELFTDESHRAQDLLINHDLNLSVFYGRCMGFQFMSDMRNLFNKIVNALAIYSKYDSIEGSFISRSTLLLLAAQKYINNPEERAAQMMSVFQNATPKFLKSFWSLGENNWLNSIPSLSKIPVCHLITIFPEELSFDVEGGQIDVPIPSAHIGRKSIQARLISYTNHEGMMGAPKNHRNIKAPARGLIIHCHGGGFLALTSRSHLVYLKMWAEEIGVPILSIDYSLSLEAHYPRALEETFYVYCWALKNACLLGWTRERIVLAGDSAGGNLILGIALKCISLSIPLPNGLCPIYTSTERFFKLSPSRLLCLMDPLLPSAFTVLCAKAYIYGNKSEFHDNNEQKPKNESTEDPTSDTTDHKTSNSNSTDNAEYSNFKAKPDEGILQSKKSFNIKFVQFPEAPCDPYLFPILIDDEDLKKFPTVKAVTTELDPLMDDSIAFCKNLKRVGSDVSLDVLPKLGHGFLNFSDKSQEFYEGCQVVIRRLSELLNLENLPPI